MPKGLVRFQQCGCYHFLTFSCHRRQPLLGGAPAYSAFEVVEIESQWTTFRRGNKLPEQLRYEEKDH
jgi:hypothetical protein